MDALWTVMTARAPAVLTKHRSVDGDSRLINLRLGATGPPTHTWDSLGPASAS